MSGLYTELTFDIYFQSTGIFLFFGSWDQGPVEFGKIAFELSKLGKVYSFQMNKISILN